MARNEMQPIDPAETVFRFNMTGITGHKFIDIGQILCLANRKGAYRQGMQYVFKAEVTQVGDAVGAVAISTLPESWVGVNAWTKAFHKWQEQQDDALEEAGLESTKGRYNDFKIHYDAEHAGAGFAANLLPHGYLIASGASATESYEWFPSQVVIPNDGAPGNTEEYFLHMIGDDAVLPGDDTKGLIKAYADSRSRPQQVDPNIVDVPSGGLYGEMQDVGDNMGDIVTNAQEANESPPYLIDVDTGVEFYPGGSEQADTFLSYTRSLLAVRSGAGSVSTVHSPYMTANCGLIHLDITSEVSSLAITVMPGAYHGVMARPMQEVN